MQPSMPVVKLSEDFIPGETASPTCDCDHSVVGRGAAAKIKPRSTLAEPLAGN